MAMLLLHNRWLVLPIIAQSRRSFNAATFICRFRMRLHGFWSHSNDFFAAASLTQSYPLKAYDAVQLAVALRHAANLATYNLPLTFVCGDRTLLAAAQAERLLTDNPFDHVAPQDTPARS
jgi:hypothetical protein